ncbi:hypothetical protein GCM10011415_05510 [Salipiger pallidus]|uniref:Uncharacterized protein n=1 Tax=Salipiger pallidus TaxID=1775170 RepID=A0A8J2ZGR3_9RHOB|nr:hypothetical protein GCM10011415_05510 [Salipiger pallidus]
MRPQRMKQGLHQYWCGPCFMRIPPRTEWALRHPLGAGRPLTKPEWGAVPLSPARGAVSPTCSETEPDGDVPSGQMPMFGGFRSSAAWDDKSRAGHDNHA